MNTYRILLGGQIDASEINAIIPLEIMTTKVDTTTTSFTVSTDQSGLVGLLRHLHGRGLVLLSVICEAQTIPSGEENVS